MTDQTIYFLIGPPSIGKSTYIKSAFDPSRIVVVSSDDAVQEVALSYGLTYDDLFTFPPTDSPVGSVIPGYEKWGPVVQSTGRFKKEFPIAFENVQKINKEADTKLYDKFNSAIKEGKDLVLDLTNTKLIGRKEFMDKARALNEKLRMVGIIFN